MRRSWSAGATRLPTSACTPTPTSPTRAGSTSRDFPRSEAGFRGSPRSPATLLWLPPDAAARRSAPNRLPAVLGELAHDCRRADRHPGPALAILHRELEVVFPEERVELLGADGTQRRDAVGRAVVVEQDRRQRLRRRPADHACACGGIVDAMVGAAMNHVAVGGRRALRLKPDERDVARWIGELVRAYCRVRNHRMRGADATGPRIARAVGAQYVFGGGHRPAEVEQEARGARIRVVEYVVGLQREVSESDRRTVNVDQLRAPVQARLGAGPGIADRTQLRGARDHRADAQELSPFHRFSSSSLAATTRRQKTARWPARPRVCAG